MVSRHLFGAGVPIFFAVIGCARPAATPPIDADARTMIADNKKAIEANAQKLRDVERLFLEIKSAVEAQCAQPPIVSSTVDLVGRLKIERERLDRLKANYASLNDRYFALEVDTMRSDTMRSNEASSLRAQLSQVGDEIKRQQQQVAIEEAALRHYKLWKK